MRFFRAILAALGRLLLGGVFLASGVNKIIYWRQIEKHFLTVLGEWQSYTASSETLQMFFSELVLWAPIILMAGTFLEILGSLLLLFGIREKLGALLLALVLIPATILTHHFWFDGGDAELQLAFLLKDAAILGGLFIVMLHGAHSGSMPNGEQDDPLRMA
jgi:uncharacterized membrane protein YphA (DoxX/SURF4 family)